MKTRLLPLFAGALFAASIARADSPPDSDDALFTEAVAALERGAADDAIDRLELLADRGFQDPNASFDRALAYVKRSDSHGARPGDLGRAAAALAEVELLAPDDPEAGPALERVRAEIARRRSRTHAAAIDQKPSLGWAVVGLFEEETWATLALAGAAAAALGLALRLFSRAAAARLAGIVVAILGGTLAVSTAPLAAFARHERIATRPAVVIVDEARLLAENGTAITGPGSVLPEGAVLRVVEQRGTLARVEWGTLEGWVSLGQLRILERTRDSS